MMLKHFRVAFLKIVTVVTVFSKSFCYNKKEQRKKLKFGDFSLADPFGEGSVGPTRSTVCLATDDLIYSTEKQRPTKHIIFHHRYVFVTRCYYFGNFGVTTSICYILLFIKRKA